MTNDANSVNITIITNIATMAIDPKAYNCHHHNHDHDHYHHHQS